MDSTVEEIVTFEIVLPGFCLVQLSVHKKVTGLSA